MNATVSYLHPWDPLDGIHMSESDLRSAHNTSNASYASSSIVEYSIHWTFFTLITLLCLYIYTNDKKLRTIPHEALFASPTRFTKADVIEAAEHVEQMGTIHPILSHLPPRSGRRYIVVGGAGFAGGWMVLHLIQRGESPANIRILDLRRPTRPDLKEGQASLVDFIQCDISNAESVHAAFLAPWPSDADVNAPLTVFHTAANIRFYERHPALLLRSAHINIGGTQNVIDACRVAGASVLIYTSSGSVAVRNTRFLLWPWEKTPERFVQSFSDEDKDMPSAPEEFFANYAYTKIKAEELVKAADGTTTNGVTLRTGAIRPGNGVYGPGGDLLCGAFLVRRMNPTWIDNVVENFCAVEVVSQAHLCYEQRLIDLSAGVPNPDIGGQSFIVTDPGPPVTYGDVFLALKTLCPETLFPLFSATGMLLMAHLVEAFYLLRELLAQSPSGILKAIGLLIPRIKGELVNLQPSVWSLVMVHLLFDGSRARLPAEQGGLGLTGGLSTLESLCLLVKDHQKTETKSGPRPQSGGMTLSWGFFAVGKKT